jgi:hypothetical protein
MHHPTLPARIAAGLLLAAAAAAHAQQSGAADAQASVPATVYRPAVDYRAAPVPAQPDRHWKASNDTVANTNSMALTMKSMGGHAGHAMPAAAPMPEPKPAPAHDHHGEQQ